MKCSAKLTENRVGPKIIGKVINITMESTPPDWSSGSWTLVGAQAFERGTFVLTEFSLKATKISLLLSRS